MIALIGNFTLWISLFFSIFQFFLSYKKNNIFVFKFCGITVIGLLLTTLLSFFLLMYGYVVSDFNIYNVFQNSHTTKPLLYKITAVWGNHEGSMLLWIAILTIFNYFIYKTINKNNFAFVLKALETQSLIIFGFLLFTILTSNPFNIIFPVPSEGLGFNPILQDPALAIHPPLLYIGYVGFSAAFSFSIATLNLQTNEKISWDVYMKPFVVTAWTFLTIGIAFGSIWAYYELGWGGWWFWDPVENASLMPWLLGTALLHSLIVVNKKKSLQSWVLLLSILVFILSVTGTFLVRSGILTSVHTFALDPFRGIYILIFATLLGCYGFILFGFKSHKYSAKNYLSFFSKEGSILINNIIMVIVCSSIFLGTIYPLIIEVFTKDKISVGEPYYNSVVVPIMIPAIIFMGIGPILSWGRDDKLRILKKILPCFILTLIITVLFFLFYQDTSFIGFLGITLGVWIITNNLLILIRKIPNYSIGMIIAHLGIGLLILGVTGSSIWQEEKIIKMKINDSTTINEYNIVLDEIKEVKGPNYVALQGQFSAFNKHDQIITMLKPEKRYYLTTKIFTTEASIHSNLLRDLYIVLGEGNSNDGWVVRVYYNPLVIWIWIGSFAIFLGGIFTIRNNLRNRKL